MIFMNALDLTKPTAIRYEIFFISKGENIDKMTLGHHNDRLDAAGA